MQTIFKVSINAFGAGSDQSTLGFVDNKTVEQYLAEAPQPSGFTVEQSMAKTQGNLRWKFILEALALMANPYTVDIVTTGADIATAPTNFTFDVWMERDAAIYTVDSTGAPLTGADAIQYAIATALSTTYTVNTEYYDPTETDSYQNGQTVTGDYNDRHIGTVVVGALAANPNAAKTNITVTVLV